jgi:hypothetical protein
MEKRKTKHGLNPETALKFKRSVILQQHHRIQSEDEILNLINDVIQEKQKVGFTVYLNNYPNNYFGESLTPLYVNFVKDIFCQKYGPITKAVIEAFGETIKTSKDLFPASYQKQQSTIKEIIFNKLYIHTSMSSQTMRQYLDNISQALCVKIKHKEEEMDPLMEEEKNKQDLPF